MPDDDELEIDGEALVADELLVEALMGWDGDPCQCPSCACPRFLDGSNGVRCAECRAGNHWAVPSRDGNLDR